jgi:hypothetical protein
MVYVEVFAFDKEAKRCGPVSGPFAGRMEDCPVPIVTYSMDGTSGSACAQYANLVLDFRYLEETSVPLHIAEELATDGTRCCDIALRCNKAKELFISPEYVVFPDHTREAAEGGPFVSVRFSFAPAGERKVADDALLVVARNGNEIIRAKVVDTEKHLLELNGVKRANDVIEWRVEGAGKKTTHRGTFGFPMSGAAPGIVEYVVSVPKGYVRQKGKTNQSRDDD